MKILKLLAMLWIATMVSMCVASCSKDDDDDSNEEVSTIVGTWRDEDESGWDQITFNSNGTYVWTFYEEGKGSVGTESGTYVYNHPVLKMTCNDEDGETWTEEYIVKSVSSSELLIEMEEEIYSYVKK